MVTRMNENAPLIFINYRSGDQALAALLLDTELTARFGAEQVFLDSRSLAAGRLFDQDLLAAVRGCGVMLSVIGRDWLTATDEHGRRLIDRRTDWVRLEIAAALGHGVPVVPVLVDDARPPSAEGLPANIRQLARHQHVRLRHRSFRSDFDHLVEQLGRLGAGVGGGPGRPPGQRPGQPPGQWSGRWSAGLAMGEVRELSVRDSARSAAR